MDECTFVWLAVEIAGVIFMTISGLASVKDRDGEIIFTGFASFGVCILIPVVLSVIGSIFFGISVGMIGSVGVLVSILVGILAFIFSELVLSVVYFWAMLQQVRYYEEKYQHNYRDNQSPQ